MTLHTSTKIRIEGREGLADNFQLLDLHEKMGGHHRFELKLPGQRFGQGQGTAPWRELLGRRIYIEITPADQHLSHRTKIFSGLITELSLAKAYGPRGSVSIKGGSPTLLLNDDPHMEAFAGQSLQQIVEHQLSAYPANLLHPQVNPSATTPLEFVVQYKESTWQLLHRLATEYGEWLFYDGQQLIFGMYDPETISLIHDRTLDEFNLQLRVHPANMQLTGYDYKADRSSTMDSAVRLPAGINIHSHAALSASQDLYPRKGLFKTCHMPGEAASNHITRTAARHSASDVAGMVHLDGTSRHPALGVSNHISIEETYYGKEGYGDFMLTEVRHQCNSEGEYHNRFKGIPVDVAAPAYSPEKPPIAEAQSAVVVDNDDPEDLGRVRVRFRWQQSGMSPWLRLLSPAGGEDKGFHMIPENGEEVWVDFEGGHPELPYVVGAVRNGSSTSGIGTAGNDIKAIRTRSGHTLELNDTEGGESITVRDKNGNSIRMNTRKKNITITAPEDMTLNAKNMKINIRENLDIQVGNSKTERIQEKLSQEAKHSSTSILKTREVRSGEKTEQVAGELTVQTSSGEMVLDGTGKVTIQSKDRIDFGE